MWPFGKKRKQEPPSGLTINKNFHLSVLAAEPLPPLLQVINPQGSNGAVQGFGAPLAEGASKDILNQPLGRGAYVLTTPNRATVLRMAVLPIKEVPGFDLSALRSAGLSGQKLQKAERAQHLIQLVFEAFEPELYPAVQFILDATHRLAELTGGVVADPLAETYRLPEELRFTPRLDPRIHFPDLGSIKTVPMDDGLWVSTRGMAKFNLPELEMYGVPEQLGERASNMLVAAVQQWLLGIPLRLGETAFSESAPLLVVEGTRQRGDWGDRPTLELRDTDGTGAAEGVTAWNPR